MIRCILALATSTIFVAGCATSGPLGNEMLNASMNPKVARVVIYRKSMIGLAVQPDYVVDSKSVAASQPGGFVACDLQPGRHIIAVSNPAISNNLTGVGSENFTLDLRAGTVTYFAAAPQIGLVMAQVTLTNVTDIQGRADVGDLHQISAACTTS
jgi:hypothetical protein